MRGATNGKLSQNPREEEFCGKQPNVQGGELFRARSPLLNNGVGCRGRRDSKFKRIRKEEEGQAKSHRVKS